MGKGSIVNKPCHCGSGKKYKKCCKDKDEYMKKEKINAALRKELNIGSIKECLFPDKTGCSEKVIKAHSIQNNRILDVLSENGEVIMLRPNATEYNFKIQAEKIGRGRATTFTGFCRNHDKVIFQPIEDSDYKFNNIEQNALFAYRAFVKEQHAKLSQYNIFSKYKNSYEKMAWGLIGAEAAIKDMEYHLDIFRKILFKKEYDLIETKIIVYDKICEFAVSSALNLSYDFEGNSVNNLDDLKKRAIPLFLTVLPSNGKTYVLLSYFKEDRKRFIFIDKQIIGVDEGLQQIRLTNILMINCENIVFSPRLWDRIDTEKQELYFSKLLKNLHEEESPGDIAEDYGLNFFIN
ncbi:MAG: SEC-C metal-binding domain-containing protein [Patescibacteria group bacterium]